MQFWQTVHRRANDAAFMWLVLLWTGALVRLGLCIATTNSFDLQVYGTVALDGALNRPLYEDGVFSYPPLWGFFFADIGKLLAAWDFPIFAVQPDLLAFVIPGLTSENLIAPWAMLLLKSPALLADTACAVAVYAVGRDAGLDERGARWAALAWWLNPLAMWVSCVQASWDSAVPLAMLVATRTALRNGWFSSGFAIALGAAAKVVPLYWIVIAPALLVTMAGRRAVSVRIAQWALGAGVAILITFGPIVLTGQAGLMKTALLTRGNSFVIGGINFFAITRLRPLEFIAEWVQADRGTVIFVSSAILLIGCALLAAVLALWPRDLRSYLLAQAALIALVCLCSPFAQPTYIVWILPFAILLGRAYDERWRALAAALTGSAFVFLGTVRDPRVIIVPVCAFIHWCSARAFAASALASRGIAGRYSENVQIDVDAVWGEVVAALLLVALVLAARGLVRRQRSMTGRTIPTRPRALGRGHAIGLAAALVAAAIIAVPSAFKASNAPIIDLHVHGNYASASSQVYSGTVHAVQVPAAQADFETLFVYLDSRYAQGRGMTETYAAGLVQHLRDDFARRQLQASVVQVDADALRRVLDERPARNAVFVPGGILPDTVRDRRTDRFVDWLERGGVAFWAGEPLDLLYSGRLDKGEGLSGPDYAPWRGQYADGGIFPKTIDPYSPPVTHGFTRVANWNASRVEFDRTTFPANVGPLLRAGGQPLAYLDEHYNSSVSVIPRGRGRVVFFGDGFDDEIRAAENIAQVVYTAVWNRPQALSVVDGPVGRKTPALTVLHLQGGDRFRLFGELPGYEPFAEALVAGTIAVASVGTSARVQSHAYAGPVDAIIMPSPHPAAIRTLYVYFDARYVPGRGVSANEIASLTSALTDQSRLRGTFPEIRVVDADALADVCNGSPTGVALVVAGGVLPETVRGFGHNVFKSWLLRGGLVFWAGAPFDVLFARAANVLRPSAIAGPDYASWQDLYRTDGVFSVRTDPFASPPRLGHDAALLWPIVRSTFDGTTYPVNSGSLRRAGGTSLAYEDENGSSSLSRLPLGAGTLILFGDALRDPSEASRAIAQILSTEVWFRPERLRRALGSLGPGRPSLPISLLSRGDRVFAFGESPSLEPFGAAEVR